MTLSVHQPNFIPWLGYFHKVLSSDVFVLLDEVQVPRGGSFANRNNIKTTNGAQLVTVPLSYPPGYNKVGTYLQVSFADTLWYRKVMKTMSHAYGKAPFYGEVFEWLESVFQESLFSEMNIKFIIDLLLFWDEDVEVRRLSELQEVTGQNNELIIEVCKVFAATTYLSGSGAKSYNAPELYSEHGILLKYQSFKHPTYPQLHGDFIPNLSIIDALFNLGFEGTRNLLINES
jgi:hypothetical protein